jgi:hypothetical protein
VKHNSPLVELDEADYEEIREAVGRGAPTLLLGTSTRSLERNLQKLWAVEQAGSRSLSVTVPENSPDRGKVSEEKAPTPDPGADLETQGSAPAARQVTLSPQAPKSPPRSVPVSSSGEAQADELYELEDGLRTLDEHLRSDLGVYEVDLKDIDPTADMIAESKDRITYIYQIMKTRVFAEDSSPQVQSKDLEYEFTDISRKALRALTTYGQLLKAYGAETDFLRESSSGNLGEMRQDLYALGEEGERAVGLVTEFREILSHLLTILRSSTGSATSTNPSRASGA